MLQKNRPILSSPRLTTISMWLIHVQRRFNYRVSKDWEVTVKMCALNYYNHHDMKTIATGGIAPTLLTSTLDGGKWSASFPCRFTPGKDGRGAHWIRGWTDRRAVLGAMEKKKCLPSLRNRTPAVQSIAIRATPPCSGSVVVEALCYKPEGRGFETGWGELICFNLHTPSSRTKPWGLLSL
jgi:hypothetical protein